MVDGSPIGDPSRGDARGRQSGLSAHRIRGFGYIGILIAVAISGALLGKLGQVWSLQNQRAKEAELLAIGAEFSRALASYMQQSPGVPDYPRSLDDLVEDRRFPTVVRHLRRVYRDPMTGEADWVLLRRGDRIVALHSRSTLMSLRVQLPAGIVTSQVFQSTGTVASAQPANTQALRYNEWVFVPMRRGIIDTPGAPRLPDTPVGPGTELIERR